MGKTSKKQQRNLTVRHLRARAKTTARSQLLLTAADDLEQAEQDIDALASAVVQYLSAVGKASEVLSAAMIRVGNRGRIKFRHNKGKR